MASRAYRFLRDSRGVAAIEFALVVPMMMAVPLGLYQVAEFVRVNVQLAKAAASMADLISQQGAGVSGGPSGALGNFCKAGQLMMTPFPTSATSGTGAFSVAMVSVTNYTSTSYTVDWESDKSCLAPAAVLGASAKTLATSPTNLLPNAGNPGDSVIIVQATYQYNSIINYLLPMSFTLTQTAFARPRNNATITCTTSCS
jgi:Flp pilus assembly protein TadG